MKKLTVVIEHDIDVDIITDALNETLHQIALDEGLRVNLKTGGYLRLDWEYKYMLRDDNAK